MTKSEYAKFYALYPITEDGPCGPVTHTFNAPLERYVALHERIRKTAIKNGCKPKWHDGIFSWGWHCTCSRRTHACDQQCSAITVGSSKYKRQAA